MHYIWIQKQLQAQVTYNHVQTTQTTTNKDQDLQLGR